MPKYKVGDFIIEFNNNRLYHYVVLDVTLTQYYCYYIEKNYTFSTEFNGLDKNPNLV